MLYRTLGRTGLRVSLVSLGAGGPSRLGSHTHQDETQSRQLVHRALDAGVNLFDVAANYGTEELLGKTLSGVPRSQYLLATKFAPVVEGEIVSPAAVVASCENSLKQLGTDVIDLYQFHGVEPDHYEAVVDQLYPAVAKLREAGKVRHIGITEYFFRDPAHRMLIRALEGDLWDTMMLKCGILNFSAEQTVLPRAAERGVGVLNMASVRVKLTRPDQLAELISGWKQRGLIAADALPAEDPLGFLRSEQVPSVIAAGYKFACEHPAVSTVIVGTGSVEHFDQNVAALLGDPLPSEHSQRIRELFGQLAEGA